MLDTLANIIEEQNQLIGVKYALFESDPKFITAVELRFTSLAFNLRAIADDDTLSVNFGELKLESDESLVEAENSDLWSSCKDGHIVWDWRLTNQQGYNDGLRLEFKKWEEESSTIVEFIVMASAIYTYSVARNKTV